MFVVLFLFMALFAKLFITCYFTWKLLLENTIYIYIYIYQVSNTEMFLYELTRKLHNGNFVLIG